MKPIKHLGQNFLTSSQYINQIVEVTNIQSKDTVLEIGPGLGALTQKIIQKNSDTKITLVEFDPRMVEHLKQTFGHIKNLTIIHENILDYLQNQPIHTKVVGSLPYYITSPILHKIIYLKNKPQTVSLLVQKEVAQKISSIEPKNSYLSVFTQTFFDVEYVSTVDKKYFDPVPKVDGGIIKLQAKQSLVEYDDIYKYEKFLHHGFLNPRKMINKAFSKELLEQAEIESTFRPQDVSLDQWVRLFGFRVMS